MEVAATSRQERIGDTWTVALPGLLPVATTVDGVGSVGGLWLPLAIRTPHAVRCVRCDRERYSDAFDHLPAWPRHQRCWRRCQRLVVAEVRPGCLQNLREHVCVDDAVEHLVGYPTIDAVERDFDCRLDVAEFDSRVARLLGRAFCLHALRQTVLDDRDARYGHCRGQHVVDKGGEVGFAAVHSDLHVDVSKREGQSSFTYVHHGFTFHSALAWVAIRDTNACILNTQDEL